MLDAYPDRAMVAELRLDTPTAYFGTGQDMFHMAFDFAYGYFWAVAYAGQNGQIARPRSRPRAPVSRSARRTATLIGSHDVARACTARAGVEWRYRRAAALSCR